MGTFLIPTHDCPLPGRDLDWPHEFRRPGVRWTCDCGAVWEVDGQPWGDAPVLEWWRVQPGQSMEVAA